MDVFVNGGKYSFGFDKLIRWIEICKRAGVEYYEMAHLFTQWGALYTPKIMATVDGTYKRIFGWDVSAPSDEYKAFVAEYLPALREVLRREGIEQNTYFHISDEPSGEPHRGLQGRAQGGGALSQGLHHHGRAERVCVL